MKLIQIIVVVITGFIITACGGGGGSSGPTVTPTPTPTYAPVTVLGTSYQNKNSVFVDVASVPPLVEIAGATWGDGETGYQNPRAVAFADFFRDGSTVAIMSNPRFLNVYPNDNPQKWSDSGQRLYFAQQQTDGSWIDVSSKLFVSSDRYICVTAGFAEVADFNNDGKPDVFFSCTGPDFTIGGVWNDTSEQYIVLSQADGKYAVKQLNIPKIYAHQVSAADINGDGNIDVISSDPKTFKNPVVLWGRGDGTFTIDGNRFPFDTYNKSIYGVRIVPINGENYVVLSGRTPGGMVSNWDDTYGTKILKYNGTTFQTVVDITSYTPTVSATGLKYGMALDVLYKNNSLYMLMVDESYVSSVYVKVPLSFTSSGTPYYANGVSVAGSSKLLEIDRENYKWADTSGVMKINSHNSINQQRAGCGSSAMTVGSYEYIQCTVNIKI